LLVLVIETADERWDLTSFNRLWRGQAVIRAFKEVRRELIVSYDLTIKPVEAQ
jgi:hypothetical protein